MVVDIIDISLLSRSERRKKGVRQYKILLMMMLGLVHVNTAFFFAEKIST